MARGAVVGLLFVAGLAWLGGDASVVLAAEESPLRAGDFAMGRLIETGSTRALQSVELDLAVYEGSVEPGLADLRVFNARGDTVPHAIRRAPSAPAPEARIEPLPVFRIGGAEAVPPSAPVGGFEIDAEISEGGAILRLRGPAPSRPGPAQHGAWLVDASGLGGAPVVGLELDLAPSAGDFVAYWRVEGSDDLTHFAPLVSRAALARFARGGHEIERFDLKLPATRARYLRLTLIEGVLPAELTEVSARIATPPGPPKRQHLRLPGESVPGEPGTFVYTLPGDLPVERIDVLPGEPNTLLDIQLDSARDPGGPWRRRHSGLVYRLDHGGTLRSGPIAWGIGEERHLRVTVSPKGGGDRQATPEIDLSWRPAQLLFVARGDAPYTLVYGRRGAPDTAFDANRIVRLAGDEGARLDDATATLGPPMVLAGDRAYEAPPKPVAWRQLALWAVLLMTVATVLGMSFRLLRGSEAAKPPADAAEDPDD